jgi:hypothetical protein
MGISDSLETVPYHNTAQTGTWPGLEASGPGHPVTQFHLIGHSPSCRTIVLRGPGTTGSLGIEQGGAKRIMVGGRQAQTIPTRPSQTGPGH